MTPPGNTHASGTNDDFECRRIISTSSGASRNTITLAAGIAGTSAASPAPRGSWRSETSWEVLMSALALPADPFFAAGPAFLFPDRNGFLDAIDHHPAGRERLGTMRRGSHDRDRRIADDQLPEPVHEVDRDLGIRAPRFIDDFRDFLLGHRSIGVVENRLHRFAFVVIAHDAFEQHVRAVGGPHHALHQRSRVDRI